jgi:hypothetical protein
MSRIICSALAVSLLAAAPAQANDSEVSVAEYLEIWSKIDSVGIREAMEKGGEIDIDKFPYAKRASEEVEGIAKAYRAQFEADRKAGRAPKSCLPDGEAEVSSDNLIPHLESYAESKRADITMVQAFADLMAKTYPCG